MAGFCLKKSCIHISHHHTYCERSYFDGRSDFNRKIFNGNIYWQDASNCCIPIKAVIFEPVPCKSFTFHVFRNSRQLWGKVQVASGQDKLETGQCRRGTKRLVPAGFTWGTAPSCTSRSAGRKECLRRKGREASDYLFCPCFCSGLHKCHRYPLSSRKTKTAIRQRQNNQMNKNQEHGVFEKLSKTLKNVKI